MANWLTYRLEVGDDVLVLADEDAREQIKNEIERSKKADAQTASFLESTTTNGIIRNGKSDPFGQTAIGGMQVVIDKGDLIINGNIKNHTRLTRTYNVTQENRTEVFLYRFDSVTNKITGLWRDCIIQGDIILSREDKTELPLRSSGYYDILICKITIPAGATEITQDMIGDFRQNEYYCGYAKNILVEIDDTLTKSDAAADAAAVGTVISDLRKETRTRDIITEKRITNLEAGLPAERWSVDDSVAYIKEVPENALPFASVDMVGGMTRKWNQLAELTKNYSNTVNGITLTFNDDGSITVNGQATARASFANVGLNTPKIVKGHVYYIECGDTTVHVAWAVTSSEGNGNEQIVTATSDSTSNRVSIDIFSTETVFNNKKYFLKIIDLTEIYGAGNEPKTVADCRIPNGYEPYDAGSLRSSPVTEVESVGVNILPEESIVFGARWEVDANGSLYIKPTSSGMCYAGERIELEPNTTYCVSTNNSSVTWAVWFTDVNFEALGRTDGWFAPNNTFTTPACHCYGLFSAFYDSNEYQNDIMINKGSTALPYTPYRRETLTIQEAVRPRHGINADVYDSITWDEDSKQRKRVKCGEVDMGTLNWGELNHERGRTFMAHIPNMKPSTTAEDRRLGWICADYNPSSSVDVTSLDNKSAVRRENSYFCVRDDDYTSAAAFKAAVSGVMIVYELTEPVITDISDILPDDNLIRVEGRGTVTMVNERRYAVPSEITYQMKGAEA